MMEAQVVPMSAQPGFRAHGAGGHAGPAGRSAAPNRIFDAVLQVARAAGLVGRKRVLDSTPIYDAVATMDTVTLVRPPPES